MIAESPPFNKRDGVVVAGHRPDGVIAIFSYVFAASRVKGTRARRHRSIASSRR